MEAGEKLEKLMEFPSFHGVQLAFIFPSWCKIFCGFFFLLKALTTRHFNFTITKNVDPGISVKGREMNRDRKLGKNNLTPTTRKPTKCAN